MKVKSESEVAQSCLTLSDPTDCSLPGSSVHGIFQARVLEWGAIAFSAKSVNTQLMFLLGFPGGSVVKNLPANAGDTGSIPGLERSPEDKIATHFSILAWKIPRTEAPGRLQSMGVTKSYH